jgi:hypothetical protein
VPQLDLSGRGINNQNQGRFRTDYELGEIFVEPSQHLASKSESDFPHPGDLLKGCGAMNT